MAASGTANVALIVGSRDETNVKQARCQETLPATTFVIGKGAEDLAVQINILVLNILHNNQLWLKASHRPGLAANDPRWRPKAERQCPTWLDTPDEHTGSRLKMLIAPGSGGD